MIDYKFIEKKIVLEDISLVDFWGGNHSHLDIITKAYPNAKILVRGNQIIISGSYQDIETLNTIIHALIQAYKTHRSIDLKMVSKIVQAPSAPSSAPPLPLIYNIYGKAVKPKTSNHVALVEAVENYDLCFAIGPAGTGKTFMMVALAVQALKNKQVKKIVISRPVVETGEHLGFLPGDVNQKIDPYLQPIYDVLLELIPSEKLKYYLEQKIIALIPLAYMRGRTFKHAFMILDEAQNTTQVQMKMFLTRIGEFSKVVITGDLSQTDLDSSQISGLEQAITILKPLEAVKTIFFNPNDIMRHGLIKDIIKAYENI